jgi:pilus assembly protein CpaF
MSDGSRKVTNITEVLPEIDESGKYKIQDIFKFVQRGRTAEGTIVGEIIPTGTIPTFMSEIEINRLPFPREKFIAPQWYVELMKKNKNMV